MMYTTLNKIRAHHPCTDGWRKLLSNLGKTEADDEPLSFLTILESNGLDDALWCLRSVPEYAAQSRLYAARCAQRVQHLVTDPRIISVLGVAERHARGEASDEELGAAWAAVRATAWAAVRATVRAAVRAVAGDAAGAVAGGAAGAVAGGAAGAVAGDAAGGAAGDAAGGAAGGAVWAVAGDAAGAAVWAVAWAAAWAAVWAVAGDAARAAAWAAERAAQEEEFRRMIEAPSPG